MKPDYYMFKFSSYEITICFYGFGCNFTINHVIRMLFRNKMG